MNGEWVRRHILIGLSFALLFQQAVKQLTRAGVECVDNVISPDAGSWAEKGKKATRRNGEPRLQQDNISGAFGLERSGKGGP